MSFLDPWIGALDDALRTVAAKPIAARPTPSAAPASPFEPTAAERRDVAGMMRVNHTGEVCAQALYSGQAIVARDPKIRKVLEQAAAEERDHLAWCDQRLRQLNDRPSLLNPLWYAGSFALGVASGLAGDRWSMAFLTETERQVESHLDGHLRRISSKDSQTAAILEQMRIDERAHAAAGQALAPAALPTPIKQAMRLMSKVMTSTVPRI